MEDTFNLKTTEEYPAQLVHYLLLHEVDTVGEMEMSKIEDKDVVAIALYFVHSDRTKN